MTNNENEKKNDKEPEKLEGTGGTHSAKRATYCPVCGKSFTSYEEMQYHYQSEHSTP